MTVRDLVRARVWLAAAAAGAAATAILAQPPAPPTLPDPPAEITPAGGAVPPTPVVPAVPPPPGLTPPPAVPTPPAPVILPPAGLAPPPAKPADPPKVEPPKTDAAKGTPSVISVPAAPPPAAVPAPPMVGLPPLVIPPADPKPTAPAPKPVVPANDGPIVPLPVVVTPKADPAPTPPAVSEVKVPAVAPAEPIIPVAPPVTKPTAPAAAKPAEPVVPAAPVVARPAEQVAPAKPVAPMIVEVATPTPAEPAPAPKPVPDRTAAASVVKPGSRATDGTAAFHMMLAEAKVAYAKVRDYSGHLLRQERVRGLLQPEQTAEVRAKTQPQSLALRWVAPAAMAGKEMSYVAGRNAGRVRLKPAGASGFAATVSVEPTDPKVMADARHPLPAVGIGPILDRLERMAVVESRLRNPLLVTTGEYTFAGRPVTRYEVIAERPHALRYAYRVVVYVDTDTKLPVRVEAYDPPAAGGPPEGDLLEAHSFVNLQFNQGLPDAMFEK